MPASGRHAVATGIGLLVFLGGVSLILLTFWQAVLIFGTPPADAVGIKPGQPLEFNGVINSLFDVLKKVLMLVVMAGVGSLVARWGVRLFSAAAPRTEEPREPAPTEPAKQ